MCVAYCPWLWNFLSRHVTLFQWDTLMMTNKIVVLLLLMETLCIVTNNLEIVCVVLSVWHAWHDFPSVATLMPCIILKLQPQYVWCVLQLRNDCTDLLLFSFSISQKLITIPLTLIMMILTWYSNDNLLSHVYWLLFLPQWYVWGNSSWTFFCGELETWLQTVKGKEMTSPAQCLPFYAYWLGSGKRTVASVWCGSDEMKDCIVCLLMMREGASCLKCVSVFAVTYYSVHLTARRSATMRNPNQALCMSFFLLFYR